MLVDGTTIHARVESLHEIILFTIVSGESVTFLFYVTFHMCAGALK